MDLDAQRLVELASAAAGCVAWGSRPAARPTTTTAKTRATQPTHGASTACRPQSARTTYERAPLRYGAAAASAAQGDTVPDTPPGPTGFVDIPPPQSARGRRTASPPCGDGTPAAAATPTPHGTATRAGWYTRRPATGGARRPPAVHGIDAWGDVLREEHAPKAPKRSASPASPQSQSPRQTTQSAGWGLRTRTGVQQRPRTAPSGRHAKPQPHGGEAHGAEGPKHRDTRESGMTREQLKRHRKTMLLARKHEKSRLELLERARRQREAKQKKSRATRQHGTATLADASAVIALASAAAALAVVEGFVSDDAALVRDADAEVARCHASLAGVGGTVEVGRDCMTPLHDIQVTHRVCTPDACGADGGLGPRRRSFAGGGGAMWVQAVRRDEGSGTAPPAAGSLCGTPISAGHGAPGQRVRFAFDSSGSVQDVAGLSDSTLSGHTAGKRLAGPPARSLRHSTTPEAWFPTSATVSDSSRTTPVDSDVDPPHMSPSRHPYDVARGPSAQGSEENGPSSSPSVASAEADDCGRGVDRHAPCSALQSVVRRACADGEMGAFQEGVSKENAWARGAAAVRSCAFELFMKRPVQANLAIENKDDVAIKEATAKPAPACTQRRIPVLRRDVDGEPPRGGGDDDGAPVKEVRAPLARDLALEELASFFEVNARVAPVAAQALARSAYEASGACPLKLREYLLARHPEYSGQFAFVDEWREAEERAVPPPEGAGIAPSERRASSASNRRLSSASVASKASSVSKPPLKNKPSPARHADTGAGPTAAPAEHQQQQRPPPPKASAEPPTAATLFAVQENGGLVRMGDKGGVVVVDAPVATDNSDTTTADGRKKRGASRTGVDAASDVLTHDDGAAGMQPLAAASAAAVQVEEMLHEAGRVRKLSLGGGEALVTQPADAMGAAPSPGGGGGDGTHHARQQEVRRKELMSAPGNAVRFVPPGYDGRARHLVDARLAPHEDGFTEHDWSTGVRTHHHASIASAVGRTGPGDTITVFRGTYEENVVIPHAVRVVAGDQGGVIVQSNTPRPAMTITAGAGPARIEGIALTTKLSTSARDTVVTGRDGVLLVESPTAEVSNCRVTAFGGHGIVVCNASSAVISGCVVTNTSRGGGIHVYDGAQAIIRENRITGCGDCAVIVEGVGTRPLITANTLTDGRGGGIVFSRRAGGTAEGNTIACNKCVGVIVDAGAVPYVTGNTIARNEGGGVRVTGAGTRGRVHNNYFDRNDDQAVLVSEEAKPHIVGNRIVGSRCGVVWITHGAGVLEHNTFDAQAVYCGVARTDSRPTCLNNTFAFAAQTGGFYACDSGRAYLQENVFAGATERAISTDGGGSVTLKLNAFTPYAAQGKL